MIKVQAFKEADGQPHEAPDEYGRDGEAHKEENGKKRSGPLIFLLFLGSVALYLKSFLPTSGSEASTQADESKPADTAEAPLAPKETTVAEAEDGVSDEMQGDEDEEAKNDEPEPDNVLVFTSSYIPSFFANDAPALEFSSAGRSTPSQARSSVGSGTPQNDNFLTGVPPSTERGSSASGGGSVSTGGTPDGPNDQEDDDPDPSGGDTDNPPEPGNRSPRLNGTVRLHDMVGLHAYFISAAALLHGASDPDGDTLSIAGLTASRGTFSPTDGGWLYRGPAGFLGDVVFTYTVTDGAAHVVQIAYLQIVSGPPIVGTGDDDNILGTPQADDIDSGAGNDNIVSLGGNDSITSGSGDDHIVAGSGDDVVSAGCGDDLVFAGAGNDVVFGGCGNDRIFGEDGDDTLYGEDGDDLLVGGAGDDRLFGGNGDDELSGGAGKDVLRGDDGDDLLVGGDGEDIVSGDQGDDYVIASMDAVADQYFGGAGHDVVDYSMAIGPLSIDLANGVVESAEVGLDQISSFEHVIAGKGNDYITTGSTFAELTGGDGDDTFDFRYARAALPGGNPLDLESGNHDPSNLHGEVVARITDFRIGDRLFVADFEIKYSDSQEFLQQLQDAFEQTYKSGDNDNRSVKFRFDKVDDKDITVVEVQDIDGDGVHDTYSIEIDGRHTLSVTMAIV